MTAQLLDGRQLAFRMREEMIREIADLREQIGKVPSLVNLIIGDSDGSTTYANAQQRIAQQLGVQYQLVRLPQDIELTAVLDKIFQWNQDPHISGIMIHKPLPEGMVYQTLANALDPVKDIEGVHVVNLGRVLLGEERMVPCTATAVMELLRQSGVDLHGKEAVIVGASEIVGKPLTLLLLREWATVTVCHIATDEAGHLFEHVGRADVLVVAVGQAGLIKGSWIKPNAVVVDVGINRIGGKLTGDVEFSTASKRAAFITPVPGGVGPVTVMALFRNSLEAFARQHGLRKGND